MDDTSVAEHLASYIADHALAPGARLPPERELAAQLGISRPALREATRRLIGLSVLEPRAGSGTYLAPIHHDDLMAVRLALEPLAAAQMATRATADQARGLQKLLADLRRLVDRPDRFARQDLAIHAAIAEGSGNRYLAGSLSELNAALRLSRARTAPDPARRTSTLTELDAVVDAIGRHHAGDAEAAMHAHLTGVKAHPITATGR